MKGKWGKLSELEMLDLRAERALAGVDDIVTERDQLRRDLAEARNQRDEAVFEEQEWRKRKADVLAALDEMEKQRDEAVGLLKMWRKQRGTSAGVALELVTDKCLARLDAEKAKP